MVQAIKNCLKIAKSVARMGQRSNFSTTRFIPFIEKLSSRSQVIGKQKVEAINSSYNKLVNQIASKRDLIWEDWWRKTDMEIARDFLGCSNVKQKGIFLRNAEGNIPTINCAEEAIRTKIALEARGIKNVSVVNLTNGADHAFCVFNRDGSVFTPFDGIINNQTVIVDTWLGKAGMANQMMKEYKTLFKIPVEDSLYFMPQDTIKLKPAELEQLKREFPNLLS